MNAIVRTGSLHASEFGVLEVITVEEVIFGALVSTKIAWLNIHQSKIAQVEKSDECNRLRCLCFENKYGK